ncbi:hypothetical protein FHC47_07200 [Klebsiella quasipneumoniae]|uniref:Uncharacterized protein n=1 Tax=Klebsiella quasipneumoniae TaxID=1463165 RepID=A0A483KLI5_9ENTR|nr:hypothetical protein [Klebsiella quasipneumoniae]QER53569.1 hypothetical protein F2980_10670 [Klebsiella quasipneumoniae subsp. quasipneumoniae]MBM5560726.1 hypothetical protein [Klebsiella quasipneumoniae]MBY5244145.1 hypothetical protein [Klebsiella quasipneumoniae]MBZ6707734.1 hypothetical protein [Klebsiella quasipneumoniae]
MMHVNRNGLQGSAICFLYVKSISVKSRIVAIKKLFWITETGTYSANRLAGLKNNTLEYKRLTLGRRGCKRFLRLSRTICQQCVNIDVNLL